MQSRTPRAAVTRTWLAVNLAAAVVFLLLASPSWVEPQVAELQGASGGAALVWMMGALPWLAAVALVDAIALLWFTLRRLRRGQWPIGPPGWLVALIWVAALAIDQLHHGV